jgi:hypothetical protein
MSDLSRLLGDVYGTSSAPEEDQPPAEEDATGPVLPAPERTAGVLPGWADETALDEAFADWVPGPPSDAPAAERQVVEGAAVPAADFDTAAWFLDEPAHPPAPSATDLEAVPAGPRHWVRADDDILPTRGRRRWR